MVGTVPYFELHIRPMFRRLDRDHMYWELDLWNYNHVSTHAKHIAKFLRRPLQQAMPTKATGGPWPEGWILVFEQWVDAGCPRLSMTSGKYSAQRIRSGEIILSIDVQLVNGAEDAWLDREDSAGGVAVYTLYLRPAPGNKTNSPRSIKVEEIITDTRVRQLIIVDAAGCQVVPIKTNTDSEPKD